MSDDRSACFRICIFGSIVFLWHYHFILLNDASIPMKTNYYVRISSKTKDQNRYNRKQLSKKFQTTTKREVIFHPISIYRIYFFLQKETTSQANKWEWPKCAAAFVGVLFLSIVEFINVQHFVAATFGSCITKKYDHFDVYNLEEFNWEIWSGKIKLIEIFAKVFIKPCNQTHLLTMSIFAHF